jgi:hypothetical protein
VAVVEVVAPVSEAAEVAVVEVVVAVEAALAPRSSNKPNHRRSTRLQRDRCLPRRLHCDVFLQSRYVLLQLLPQHPSLRKLQRQREPLGSWSSQCIPSGKTLAQPTPAVCFSSSLPPSKDCPKIFAKLLQGCRDVKENLCLYLTLSHAIPLRIRLFVGYLLVERYNYSDK